MPIAMTPPQDAVEARTMSDIAAAVGSGNLRRAYDLSNWAITRGMTGRIVHNARALALQASGRQREAIEDFRRALTFSPNDPGILNAIGMSELSLLLFPDAIRSFEAAIAIEPSNPLTHYRLGMAYGMSGEHEAARPAYERAVLLKPDYTEALASLASLTARKGEAQIARDYAQKALTLDPAEPTALLALAILDIGDKRFAEAEPQLRSLAANPRLNVMARSGVQSLLGDALDGQERYAEAFAAYQATNDEVRRQLGAQFESARGADAVGHLTAYFKDASPERWMAPDEGDGFASDCRQHVFLLGFMRSGTTLLEQILASNPDVVALEEKGTLNALGTTFMTSNDGMDALSDLRGGDLAAARRLYWEKVAASGESPGGKIFVDKQPLNTLKLPLIAKLFPQARILFALRDPRDVVFSCFRRHFRVNPTAFEFLTLEGAAQFYSAIMSLAQIYREKLKLDILDHYYEDMVTDFEPRVRAVCEFIGLEWSDSMREFNRNAPKVDLRSPSARQVQRPLYGEGVGQWRRYAEQLSPIQPIVRPWVEKFGYPAE